MSDWDSIEDFVSWLSIIGFEMEDYYLFFKIEKSYTADILFNEEDDGVVIGKIGLHIVDMKKDGILTGSVKIEKINPAQKVLKVRLKVKDRY